MQSELPIPGRVVRATMLVVGIVLCLTGIGAIIGIPMLYVFAKTQEEADRREAASPA